VQCGPEPGGSQDPPGPSLVNAVPKAGKLALDAPVAPARVLPGRLVDKLAYLVRIGGRPEAFG
jgi:hypothetical protein